MYYVALGFRHGGRGNVTGRAKEHSSQNKGITKGEKNKRKRKETIQKEGREKRGERVII